MTTAKDLIKAGIAQGPWIPEALAAIESGELTLAEAVEKYKQPDKIPLQSGLTWHTNLEALTEDEKTNFDSVQATMKAVMQTPGVKYGAVMPDACPAGPVGIIPVGGVVASEYIHPAMHSADVCCSVMMSTYKDMSPAEVLEDVHRSTHFGPGGRERGKQFKLDAALAEQFAANDFLKSLVSDAGQFLGTQGDGNHFAFVGSRESDGATCLVTHHGSRKPGAMLYKQGTALAKKQTHQLCPETRNYWLDVNTAEGEEYWNALQIIREWTKANHRALHFCGDREPEENFWNEHNFVFRKSDGLFYHAKGATPAWDGWAEDATDYTLIPLNMSEPVLIARGKNADHALGFAPHGAGRNFSRSQHKRQVEGTNEEIFARETQGLDVRFYSGEIDVSELPSAYKNADEVQRQMRHFGLADVADRVLPFGCIMAGDWQKNAPWKKRKKKSSQQPVVKR